MTLDQLRAFVAVAQREHLTKAALELNLTPSAVSSAIHSIERQYGTQLFHRVGRHIELTTEGRAFLPEARALLASAASTKRALLELGGLTRGTLVIAASKTIASYWLPPILLDFAKQYPGVRLVMHEVNTAGVLEAIRSGIAELGLVEDAIDDNALAYLPLIEDRITIVVSPTNKWARRSPTNLTELLPARWVMREKGSGTRAVTEAAFRAAGIDPAGLRILLEVPTNEALCTAVALNDDVIAALPEVVARAQIEAGHLVRTDVCLTGRYYALVRHKERYRSNASRAMETLIEKAVRKIKACG